MNDQEKLKMYELERRIERLEKVVQSLNQNQSPTQTVIKQWGNACLRNNPYFTEMRTPLDPTRPH
jgi:tetrahydromethanopterin S-methyltransferase subunit B